MPGSRSESSGVIPSAPENTPTTPQCLVIQSCTQGNDVPFWEVWKRYRSESFIRQSLHWMDGNHADAEDALSNSSLKALQYLSAAPHDIRHIKGAFARLLHNHCMGVWRERQKQAKCLRGLAASLRRNGSATAARQESAEDTLLRREMAALIRHALQRLPPRLRETAVLRFVDELSYDEIAVRLHSRPENVRKRIQQARTLLQEQIHSYRRAGVSPLGAVPGFSALRTPPTEVAPEPPSVTCQAPAESTPDRHTLGVVRVNLPGGAEAHQYLIFDRRPARQQQKLETLRMYVQRHPHGWKKRRVLAELLLTMGQWEEAVTAYQHVVRQHPHCPTVWLRLGELWQLCGRTDEAVTAYARALSLAAGVAAQRHVSGRIALCRRQFAAAVRAFAAATDLEPAHAAYRQSLGLAHLHAAQPVAALQVFDTLLQRNPDDLLALTYSPAVLHVVGRRLEAQRRAARALALDPTNVLALTYLARHRIRTEQGRETPNRSLTSLLRRAHRIAPDAPEVHEALARHHMFRGEWSQGVALLHAYTHTHPQAPRGWYCLAHWSFRSGAISAAAVAIRRAYALDPHDPAILQAACTILLAADRRAEVEPLLNSMLKQFPEDWRVWSTAASILLHGYGKKARACRVADRGPQLQPQLAQAWFQSGRVLALAGRHREAIATWHKGYQCLADEADEGQTLPVAVWLGTSYETLGHTVAARKWWAHAIELSRQCRNSHPALAHYWQGKAFLALRQMAEAQQAWQAALHWHLFYPERQEVQDILQAEAVEEKTA